MDTYVLNCSCCTGGGPPYQPCGCPAVPPLQIILTGITVVGGPSPTSGCTTSPSTGCPITLLTDAFPIGVGVPMNYYATDPGPGIIPDSTSTPQGAGWGGPAFYAVSLAPYSLGNGSPTCGTSTEWWEEINLECVSLIGLSGVPPTWLGTNVVNPGSPYGSYTVQASDLGNYIYFYIAGGASGGAIQIIGVNTGTNEWTLGATVSNTAVTYTVYSYILNVESVGSVETFTLVSGVCSLFLGHPGGFEWDFTSYLSNACPGDTTLRASWKIIPR